MSTFYVLKYKDKYYAPYKDLKAYASFMDSGVDDILTDDISLAIRFGDEEIARVIQQQELESRVGDVDFNPKDCRIVKVTRKDAEILSALPDKNAN